MQTRKRPWRLHASTFVVSGVALAALVLANVPGRPVLAPDLFRLHQYGPRFDVTETGREHGWPLTYLWRDPAEGIWAVTTGVVRFGAAALATNLLIAALIVTGTTIAFEFWRRRRIKLLQFSLAELLALVLVAALCLAWLEANRRVYRKEAAALVQLGADDESWHAKRPGGPPWLRALLGDATLRIFDRVVEVERTGDNARLEYLNELKHLKTLHLFDAPSTFDDVKDLRGLEALEIPIADVGGDLEQLKDLTNLQGLNLWGTNATNHDLRFLSRLTKLRFLAVGVDDDGGHAKFDNEGMAYIGRLTKLQSLYIGSSQITNDGLAPLAGLSELKELGLWGERLSDDGLVHLRDLAGLQKLCLVEMNITEGGLLHLKNLTNLRELWLYDTQITDAGLMSLKGLKNLEYLDLEGTSVTQQGIDDLKQCLPNTYVAGP